MRAAMALLVALAAAIASSSAAAEPIWLEPFGSGVAALHDDGTVVRNAQSQGGADRLASAWQSDRLLACDDRLLGVDGSGRLAVAGPGGAVGPAVSPHADALCLPDGSVVAVSIDGSTILRLDRDLEVEAERSIAALPDTQLVAVGDAVALLVDPTFRYRHGVLGDEIEAAGVAVLRAADLEPVATWTLEAPAVLEQRGLAATELWRAADGTPTWGLIVTRSTPNRGAQVVVLGLQGDDLREIAAGAPIGRPNRWLHVFAADRDSAWSVRTPHLGGPLVRWRLPNAPRAPGTAPSALTGETFALGVTSHLLGSRNLEQAILLAPDPAQPGVDLLVVRCAARCQVTAELPLSGRLTTNLAAVSTAAGPVVFAGDDTGAVLRFPLDLRGEVRR